ncbi:MAG: hypothetical protein RL326_9 [Pseudomonadota bacterium]|jgi:WD40 repeat protein
MGLDFDGPKESRIGAASDAATAKEISLREIRGADLSVVRDSVWDWKLVHTTLCNEPTAQGLLANLLATGRPDSALAISKCLAELGHPRLSASFATQLPDYDGAPKTSSSIKEFAAATERSLASYDAPSTDDEEEAYSSASHRLSLVNSTNIAWCWENDLLFSRGYAHDGTLRPVPLVGHSEQVNGALCLAEAGPNSKQDVFLSWSDDGTLRIWRVGTDQHKGPPALPDTHVLAMHSPAAREDRTRVSSECLSGHQGPVRGAFPLPDGRIVSWGDDCTVRVWQRTPTGEFAGRILQGHERPVLGVKLLDNGELCSWDDKAVCTWA